MGRRFRSSLSPFGAPPTSQSVGEFGRARVLPEHTHGHTDIGGKMRRRHSRLRSGRVHTALHSPRRTYVAPLMMIHSTPLVGGGGTARGGGRSPAAAPPGDNHTSRRKPAVQVSHITPRRHSCVNSLEMSRPILWERRSVAAGRRCRPSPTPRGWRATDSGVSERYPPGDWCTVPTEPPRATRFGA